jgi:protein SCO1/2
MRTAIAAACIALALISPAYAANIEAVPGAPRGAIGSTVPDFAFQSVDDSRIALRDFRGKPLLITLIYTSCSDVCPVVIENLAAIATTAESTLGEGSFNIVVIGFDVRNDTPERMRSFARAHDAGGQNWHFVSSDSKTIDRLSEVIGFDFFASAGGFSHIAQVTILNKDGEIYEQVYGSDFQPPAIVEPLKQLVFGQGRPALSIAGLGDRIKLYCTVFDRKTGRYYFSYALPISVIIGLFCLLGILAFLIRETRKSFKASGQ